MKNECFQLLKISIEKKIDKTVLSYNEILKQKYFVSKLNNARKILIVNFLVFVALSFFILLSPLSFNQQSILFSLFLLMFFSFNSLMIFTVLKPLNIPFNIVFKLFIAHVKYENFRKINKSINQTLLDNDKKISDTLSLCFNKDCSFIQNEELNILKEKFIKNIITINNLYQ